MDEREQTRLSYLAGAFWQSTDNSFSKLVEKLDLASASKAFREAVKVLEEKASVRPEHREALVEELIASKKRPSVDAGRALAWAREAHQMSSRRAAG